MIAKFRSLMRRKRTERYLALRRKYGYSAHTALHYARQPLPKPLEWNGNVDHAEWTEAGFDLVAHVEPDDNPDYSYLGEFTTKYKRGAIKVDPSESGDDRIYPVYRSRYPDSPTPVYFVPCNSYREHFKGLRELHYGRSEADTLARSYVHNDMVRLRSLHRGDWDYVGVIVTASRNGIKLGNASVWGIERYGRNTPGFDRQSDSEAYFTETARELAIEAISEAKNAIGTLCASRRA